MAATPPRSAGPPFEVLDSRYLRASAPAFSSPILASSGEHARSRVRPAIELENHLQEGLESCLEDCLDLAGARDVHRITGRLVHPSAAGSEIRRGPGLLELPPAEALATSREDAAVVRERSMHEALPVKAAASLKERWIDPRYRPLDALP